MTMKMQSSNGAWVLFQQAAFFLTFILSVVSIHGILYFVAGNFLPETTSRAVGYYATYQPSNFFIRAYLATLLINGPLFLLLLFFTQNQIKKNPEIRSLHWRKLFLLFTMTIIFMIAIGNGIYTLFNILNGTQTQQHIINILIVLLLYGSVFYYLFTESKAINNHE